MFRAFFPFLLHNHFITDFFFKKKFGDVNDEANFSFFILLHKRANPILPPYLLPHLRARTQTYTPPSYPSFRPPIRPYLIHLTSHTAYLSAHTSHNPLTLLSARVTYERQSVCNRSQKNPPFSKAFKYIPVSTSIVS
jgi:hypothetical protein